MIEKSNEDKLADGIRRAGLIHRRPNGEPIIWRDMRRIGIQRESGDPGKSGRFGLYSRRGSRVFTGIWASLNADGTVDVELEEGARYTVTLDK
jgi:hypothetical protein